MIPLIFLILGIGFLTQESWALLDSKVNQEVAASVTLRMKYRLMSEPLTPEKLRQWDPGLPNPSWQWGWLKRTVHVLGLKAKLLTQGQYGVQIDALDLVSEGYVREGSLEEQAHQMQKAQQAWEQIVHQHLGSLTQLLSRLRAKNPEQVLEQTSGVLKNWRRLLEEDWKKLQVLLPGLPKDLKASHLEPAGTLSSQTSKAPCLARLPVRFWQGWWTVRVSISVMGQTLNGRFIISPELERSVVAQDWLESQGMLLSLIRQSGLPFQRVNWGQLRPKQGSLALPVFLNQVELGGWVLPLQELLLAPSTEFFTPPSSIGFCCDGVLGRDFLRLYPMAFKPDVPEVILWSHELFQPPHGFQVQPIYESKEHRGGLFAGISNQIQFAEIPHWMEDPFVLDLSQGKLWRLPESSLKVESPQNRSGIELRYVLVRGERILRVHHLDNRYLKSFWKRRGFQKGTQILEVDRDLAEELEQWSVNQRLLGKFSDTIFLKWKTKQGAQSARFLVRPKSLD